MTWHVGGSEVRLTGNAGSRSSNTRAARRRLRRGRCVAVAAAEAMKSAASHSTHLRVVSSFLRHAVNWGFRSSSGRQDLNASRALQQVRGGRPA